MSLEDRHSHRILIVEDEVLIAKHIENLLEEQEGFTTAGIAHDSETALDLINIRDPNFIILDVNINGSRDGIEVAEIIKEKYDIPFIFLTALSDVHTLDRAKKVNPFGYLVKPFKAKDLLNSIIIARYNFEFRKTQSVLSQENINQLCTNNLTDKEFEVLVDITEGFTNAQIAKKQFISLSTVKYHTQNIYAKLAVKNRSSAIKKVLDT